MKSTRNFIIPILASLLIFSACSQSTPSVEKITIAAASDLRFALDDLIILFKKSHPNSRVDVIYGSSGKIHTQIQQGAPYDLFFSADVAYPRRLMEAGLASSGVMPYAYGKLVLWSKLPSIEKRDAKSLSLAILADPAIKKIAIANPQHAPYGKRAEQALKASGHWESVKSKLIFGEDIAQTAQFALSGNADAAIIALSLALNPAMGEQGVYSPVPENLYDPLEQAFIITAHAANNPLAKQFAAFMLAKEAREMMIHYGFTLPTDITQKK